MMTRVQEGPIYFFIISRAVVARSHLVMCYLEELGFALGEGENEISGRLRSSPHASMSDQSDSNRDGPFSPSRRLILLSE